MYILKRLNNQVLLSSRRVESTKSLTHVNLLFQVTGITHNCAASTELPFTFTIITLSRSGNTYDRLLTSPARGGRLALVHRTLYTTQYTLDYILLAIFLEGNVMKRIFICITNSIRLAPSIYLNNLYYTILFLLLY